MPPKDKYFTHIGKLYGQIPNEFSRLCGADLRIDFSIENAYLKICEGKIAEVGKMDHLKLPDNSETVSLEGKTVIPAYADSHTHIVFAAPREHEFEMKLAGKSYLEIAAMGGGIVNSAKKLQETSEEDLYQSSAARLRSMIAMGTGAIEIKSGYGLTIDAELKMLRVIRRLKETFPIPIKATYLGAHAVNPDFTKETYLAEVVLPAMRMAAEQGLTDFVDIFIEQNYFSNSDAEIILNAAETLGLRPKLHVNQLTNSGALQVAVGRNALSADHLEEMGDAEIACLKGSKTMPTALPSCSFFLRIPYAPLRKMIDSGLGVALATDYNPGSTPSGNMNFVIALACIQQRLLPIEALHAATLNGAYAMNLENEVGKLIAGYRANFLVLKNGATLTSVPYNFGNTVIDYVVINGERYFCE